MDSLNEFRFQELGKIPDKTMEPWKIVYNEGGKMKFIDNESGKKIDVLNFGDIDQPKIEEILNK